MHEGIREFATTVQEILRCSKRQFTLENLRSGSHASEQRSTAEGVDTAELDSIGSGSCEVILRTISFSKFLGNGSLWIMP